MEETLRANLLDLAARYKAATGRSFPSIGDDALNDNTFFARIQKGKGFTIKTFDRVVDWFSNNWPDGAEWPSDVLRPGALAQCEAVQ
jgi:hypothetical protein